MRNIIHRVTRSRLFLFIWRHSSLWLLNFAFWNRAAFMDAQHPDCAVNFDENVFVIVARKPDQQIHETIH